MDIEGPGPVCEHGLLRDEAVVAPSSAPLVGEVHGALVRAGGLVVMIRHGGMGGRSAREGMKGRIKNKGTAVKEGGWDVEIQW